MIALPTSKAEGLHDATDETLVPSSPGRPPPETPSPLARLARLLARGLARHWLAEQGQPPRIRSGRHVTDKP